MTGKMAIVGDGDSIMVFQAAGVSALKARDILRKIAKDYEVIFLTEELARPLADFLKRFDETPYPVVLPIPSGKGGAGLGEELVRGAAERALGIDIFLGVGPRGSSEETHQ